MNYIYILLFWVWDIYIYTCIPTYALNTHACIYTYTHKHIHTHSYIHTQTNPPPPKKQLQSHTLLAGQ